MTPKNFQKILYFKIFRLFENILWRGAFLNFGILLYNFGGKKNVGERSGHSGCRRWSDAKWIWSCDVGELFSRTLLVGIRSYLIG